MVSSVFHLIRNINDGTRISDLLRSSKTPEERTFKVTSKQFRSFCIFLNPDKTINKLNPAEWIECFKTISRTNRIVKYYVANVAVEESMPNNDLCYVIFPITLQYSCEITDDESSEKKRFRKKRWRICVSIESSKASIWKGKSTYKTGEQLSLGMNPTYFVRNLPRTSSRIRSETIMIRKNIKKKMSSGIPSLPQEIPLLYHLRLPTIALIRALIQRKI